jgi:TAP-like protein
VQVPLDWNHPNGPEITLAVARHRASKPNERIGSMFINYGGPGVPGVPPVLTAGLLTLQGYGHTSEADPSTCLDDAVTKYLVTVATPPVGTLCQPNRAPFDPDFGNPLFREQPVD